MRSLHAFTLVALLGSVIGCGSDSTPDATDGEVARSALPRDTTPDTNAAERAEVSRSNLAFAQALYGQVAAGAKDNAFFSPLSVTYALAMTWAGARGDTAKEMGAALRFTMAPEKVHPALNALDLDLSSRGKGAEAKDGTPFRLRIVNSVWGERTTSFEAPFLDVLGGQYDAGVRLVDFIGAPNPSRVQINGWVEKQTEGKIKNLLSEGSVTNLTRLVLVNAVYFNGAWRTQFEASKTRPSAFAAPSGSVDAPTMHVESGLPHAKTATFEAVALPYQDERLQLMVVMPVGSDLATLEKKLATDGLGAVSSTLKNEQVALAMPKFKIDGAAISLRPALETLGMKKAFLPGAADFSGMQAKGGLYVSDVVHRAFVEVDEKGTEAAAATGVIVGTTSAPPPPIPVNVDRPFAFYLRDVTTDTILFAGHVQDPTR